MAHAFNGKNPAKKLKSPKSRLHFFCNIINLFSNFVSITKRQVTDSVTVDPNRTHYSYFSPVLNGTLQFALSMEKESSYIYSKFNSLKYGHPIKTDPFYGPLSFYITGFDRKYNETYDTIFELDKIWGREEDHKKGKVSPSMLPLIT